MSAPLDDCVAARGETLPMSLPAACPILIGRSSSLAQLVQLAERASEGRGTIALVSGDAGIGKSRLLADARRQILAPDASETATAFQVLEGRCFEEDRDFPYAPLLDLLRRNLGPEERDQITSLLPQLGAVAATEAGGTMPPAPQVKRQMHVTNQSS